MMAPPAADDPRAWAVPLAALALLITLWVTETNTTLFTRLNGCRLLPDGFWAMANVLGDGLVLFALMLIFVGRRPDIVRALIIVAALAILWTHGLKPLFAEPRPAAVLDPEMIHIIGLRLTGSNAFPSGHATGATAWIAAVALMVRTRWMALFLPLMVVVTFSRVMVGAHWPLDIAAGILGGWLAAVFGIRIAARWQGGLSPKTQTVAALVFAACALALPWHDLGYPQARSLQAVIGFVILASAVPVVARAVRSHRGRAD